MKLSKKKLVNLAIGATPLMAEVIGDAVEELEGGNDTYLQQVLEHGCVSGMVSGLIYYSDTTKFYDKYTEDIWDILEDARDSMGHSTILETIASLNGSKDVGSDEQLKNLLAWFGYEETARQILDKLEIEY